MRKFLATLSVCGLLVMSGCLELTQTITVNPDGAGKTLIDAYGPADMPNFGGGEAKKPDPQAMAKQFAQQQIGQAKGVDAWSDVSYEVAKDGRMHFVGTAYFPDITKVKVGMGEEGGLMWTKEGNTVVMQMKNKEADKPADKPLSDEEAQKKVAEAKKQWEQSKPMVQMMFGTLKLTTNYVLPGKVTETNGFAKTDKGVSFTIDGKKVMEVMDDVMKDDAALVKAAKEGRNPTKDQDVMMEKMFGVKGPLKAKIENVAPLFDYKAESDKAKAGEQEMLKKLGLSKQGGGGFNIGG